MGSWSFELIEQPGAARGAIYLAPSTVYVQYGIMDACTGAPDSMKTFAKIAAAAGIYIEL
jgi:hypothetical protein